MCKCEDECASVRVCKCEDVCASVRMNVQV